MIKENENIQVGDWVAYYQAGTIVLGEVRYIQSRIGLDDLLCTPTGSVSRDSVLEYRKPE